MKKLGYEEAFARFGARLKNVRWSVCAEAPDGSLVVSLWEHRFENMNGKTVRYVDDLSRWEGHGNRELRMRLLSAYASRQIIRPVIAKAESTQAVESGSDASQVNKSFSVREDWTGRVVELDEPRFVIEFKSEGGEE
jgi:hypothetical protein